VRRRSRSRSRGRGRGRGVDGRVGRGPRRLNLTPRRLRRRRYLPHTPLVRRRRRRSRSRSRSRRGRERGRRQGMPSPRSGCEVPRPSRGVRYLSIDAR